MGFTSELEGNVESLRAFMAKVPDNDDPALTEARRAADEELPEAIGFIRTSTRKMDNLINAILKISREGRRQLKPETVNLKALLDASASTIHHQVTENGGEVVIDLQAPILVSDRLSLEQIFGNLFDNAVKYRQPDRPIRIEVRGRAEGRDRIVVEIEDNGRGIAPQDHDRVFELFRRSGNQSVPGEGIGLSHVRTVVRNLGGEIRLRSELGSGTTFTISLPRDLRKVIGSTTQ
jgi:signal transduction histidine kinase